MRLTLRRLLAYLDDILDPSDQEAIRKKIDESEFATDLLHRTRDAMRRLRLGTPTVLGGDGGLDPNTVAEYLDHTLPQEQVEDFERFCLESDIHLAEAGSCHQILTMVLGEPAEVEPDARQRMYSISAPEAPAESPQEAAPHVSADSAPATADPLAPPVATIRAAVPDYLRPVFVQRHRGKLATIAALFVAVIAYFLWPSDVTPVPKEWADAGDLDTLAPPIIDGGVDSLDALPSSTVGDADSGDFDATDDSVAPPFVPGQPAESDATGSPEVAEPRPPSANDGGSGTVELSPESDLPPPLEEAMILPPDRAVATPDALPTNARPDVDPSSAALPDQPIPAEPDATTPSPATGLPASETKAVPITGDPSPALPPANSSDVSADGSSDPAAMPTPTSPEGLPVEDPASPASEPDPAKRDAIATYSQERDILLRLDSEQGGWIRLPDNAELFGGDVLLAVPACRPTISLMSGVLIRLDGGSQMVILGNDAGAREGPSDGMIGIELVYGRAIFRSALPGPTMVLRIGNEQAKVHFPGAAELAVEVRRSLPAGADPLKTSAEVAADFYAASGGLQYQSELSHFDVAPHSSWHLTAERLTAPAPLGERTVPKWVEGTMASPIEKARAIPGLSAVLVAGEPIELHLSELIDHPHEEIRRLAGRTSVHVGQFEPFVSALNDSDQRAAWRKYIPSLKTALAAGPKVANEVQQAFRRQKGDDGDVLFRMLWGYSEKEIDQDLLRELIHRLDHESLDFRVLAIHNLKEITGKTLGYQPEYGREARKRYIKKWKNRLDENELLPVNES